MTAADRSGQLALNLRLRDGCGFANFVAAAPQREAVERLRDAVDQVLLPADVLPAPLFVAGEAGSGKSHLLQAACCHAQEQGAMAVYLPLEADLDMPEEALDGLVEATVLCVDDIHAIAGDSDWERRLFSLFERQRAEGGLFIAAGRAVPAQLGLAMPELRTRLAGGLVFTLRGLDDDGLRQALRERARNRGLDMSDEVAAYLLSRVTRNPPQLFALLDDLDRAALAAQRRLTVPFVGQVLESKR